MRFLIITSLLVLSMAHSSCGQTVNRPQFRRVHSDGLAEGATLPDTSSTTNKVVWKADIPGWGGRRPRSAVTGYLHSITQRPTNVSTMRSTLMRTALLKKYSS